MRPISIFALVLAPTLAFADGKNVIEPGMWELSGTVTIGDRKLPPSTDRKCASPEMTTADGLLKALQNKQANDCRFANVKITGKKLTWTLECGPKGTGSGEIRVITTKSYEGNFSMPMTDPTGKKQTVQLVFNAKHVGPCEPNQSSGQ